MSKYIIELSDVEAEALPGVVRELRIQIDNELSELRVRSAELQSKSNTLRGVSHAVVSMRPYQESEGVPAPDGETKEKDFLSDPPKLAEVPA